MFVPVSCTHCGKPFQVPESALGKLAPCPWCQATVTALPGAAPLPAQQTASQPAAPMSAAPTPADAPLSLDDPAPEPPAVTRVAPRSTPAAPAARRKWNLTTILIGAGVVTVVMAATMAYRNYGTGRFSDVGWTDFTPPDGSFTVALPGSPTEEEVGPNPEGSVTGGKRFTVRGWYSKTVVWVAYTDLSPALVQKLPGDKDRIITAGVLRVERDREVSRLKGTVTKEAEARLNAGWGVEVHMDTPNGRVVERLILMADGPRPRLYVYGVEGKNVTPTSPACAKLFGSFRVNN